MAKDYTDYLPDKADKMNPLEKELFNSNPYYGSMCLVVAQVAMDATQRLFSSSYGYHNDNADAFRHSYWNGRMTIFTTQDFAKKFADAHEDGGIRNPDLEREMDFYNNNEGRYRGLVVYQNNPIMYVSLLETEILRVLKIGNMKRYWGNDIGKLTYLVRLNGNGLF